MQMTLTILHAISVVNLKENMFFSKFLVGLWKRNTFSSGLTMVGPNDLDHILVSIKYELASSKHITCIPLLGMFDFTYFVILFMLISRLAYW